MMTCGQESCLVHTSDVILFLLQGEYTWGDANKF